MIPPPSTEALVRELLCKTGRIGRDQAITVEPMPGNPDRSDFAALSRFVVRHETSPLAVLVVGTDLAQLRLRTELFAQAYPDLACPVFAHANSDGHDLLLTEHFAGFTAGDALNHPDIGEGRVIPALEFLADRFNREIRPSTADAFASEIERLQTQLLAIPYWTAADRMFLNNIVFPFATKAFSDLPLRSRVSNGDFVLGNILLNTAGGVRVIDYEQAAATHFYAEDWLRFTYWKTPEKLRAFALARIDGPIEPVQLYLWLKQMVFEAAVNQPSKAQSDLQYWGRELRRMLDREDLNLQGSLLWPTEKRSDVSQLLQLQSKAQYNYTRAIELYNFARQRELKIRQMQQSFSWRATAWLRALRRISLDRRADNATRPAPELPQEAPPDIPFAHTDFFRPGAIQLRYHINRPADWSAKGDILIEGSVFTDLAIKLSGIRARVGERVYPGTYGLDRPEIADKFLPQATSGFSVAVKLTAADSGLVLEAGDDQGVWYPFHAQSFGLTSCRTNHVPPPSYTNWVARFDTLDSVQLETLRSCARALINPPLISVVMPVYNIQEDFLSRAIESVQAQVYPHWELCIADDASTQQHIRPLIERYAREDSRIKPVFRPTNGHISAASNSAIEIASGDFTAFLDHDDELAPHALFCVARLIMANPAVEVIYTDEDKLNELGHRFSPHFKPDWNPDLLTSQNYFCHLTVYRTSTLRSLGGMRPGFEGSQDWDLALRVTEKLSPAQIVHIPRVLYHWRAIEGSTADSLSSKQYTAAAGRKAVEEHFVRKGRSVKLTAIMGGHWRVHHPVSNPPPSVTLVIPTRNRRELLVKCVESILEKTTYANFEILIADNDSDDPKLRAYYKKAVKRGRFSVISCPGPFNYSAINNRAVEQAQGEIIGLLNNDLEAINAGWLDEMVGHALRPEIGVVGAKLYYPDMSVQHAGVVTGIGGVAGHAFKHTAQRDPGTPQNRAHVTHNVSALTAACVVLRKSVFLEAGGFDEQNLKVAFNDVDFCLRVEDLGYRNLFTPFAEFIHHESASRGAEDSPEKVARFQTEVAYMKQRWGERLLNDPAYNPNLSLETEDFGFACPPRTPCIG